MIPIGLTGDKKTGKRKTKNLLVAVAADLPKRDMFRDMSLMKDTRIGKEQRHLTA